MHCLSTSPVTSSSIVAGDKGVSWVGKVRSCVVVCESVLYRSTKFSENMTTDREFTRFLLDSNVLHWCRS